MNEEQIGHYNKDRLVHWFGVIITVLIATGSVTTMVLVTIRVQDQQIQRLIEADDAIKKSLMRQIMEARGIAKDNIEEIKKEIMLARKYQKENREKIAQCEKGVSNIMGMLEVTQNPHVPAIDLFNVEKFGIRSKKIKTQ